MNQARSSFWQKLLRRFFLIPAGYGRPADPGVMDREYTSGAWAHFHQPQEQPRQAAVVDYVARVHAEPSVLDLGCGSGRLAQLLLDRPIRRYVGVDFSPEGLRLARELALPRAEFVEGDFETWLPADKFDVIIFSECIGYAHDPGRLIARFLPWLERDGAVIISLYRSESWPARWQRVYQHVQIVAETTVTNDQAQIWDIRLLRPIPA